MSDSIVVIFPSRSMPLKIKKRETIVFSSPVPSCVFYYRVAAAVFSYNKRNSVLKHDLKRFRGKVLCSDEFREKKPENESERNPQKSEKWCLKN